MGGPVLDPLSGSTAPPSPNSLISPFNPTALDGYLREVLSVTLGATNSELEAPGSLFHRSRFPETFQKLSRYAAEPLVVLYATKDAFENDQPLRDLTSTWAFAQTLASRA